MGSIKRNSESEGRTSDHKTELMIGDYGGTQNTHQSSGTQGKRSRGIPGNYDALNRNSGGLRPSNSGSGANSTSAKVDKSGHGSSKERLIQNVMVGLPKNTQKTPVSI